MLVLRDGYYRKAYTRSDGVRVKKTYVPPAVITDRGNPGKGPNVIGKLKKGTLRQFGYSSSNKENSRHNALRKAVKNLGYSTIIKKLNAVSILNKNTNPLISKKFKKDMKWVQTYLS